MTSKDLSIFNSLRPFSIGFDDMFDQFESMLGGNGVSIQSNYPPYNIENLEKINFKLKLLLLVLEKMMLKLSMKIIF